MKRSFTSSRGASSGKKKRITDLTINVYNTLGLKAGQDVDNVARIPGRIPANLTGEGAPWFTGEEQLKLPNKYNKGGDFVIVQELPLPATIISLTPNYDTFGPE